MKNSTNTLMGLSLAALLSACGGGSGGSSNGGVGSSGSGTSCNAQRAVANSTPAVMSTSLASPKVTHIPAAVRTMADQGKLAETQQVPVTIALKLNNQADLEGKIAEMYQPGNPNFHQFMTPDQFKARYAPTSDQVNQVQSYLKAQGLSVTAVNDNGYLIQAKGTTQALNTAFQTEIHQYKNSAGTQYFAPSTEPVLPSDLPIQAVHGLQNVTQWKSYAKSRNMNGNPVKSTISASGSGTGSDGGYAPADIRTAYQIPTSVTGAGQTLGLMELDGYTASDITAYESAFSLPSVPLSNVLIDGATGSPGGGQAEVTLDIELMTAIAPGASKIIVYEGENSSQGILDVYAKIASDNTAKEISSSWGTSEDSNTSAFAQSENTIFEQMAAQGQSMFAAAGDDGADDNGSSLSVDDPAAQPYVVGVGGTTLSTGSGEAYAGETTWDDSSSSAGGGGISTVWPIPSYQAGLASSANEGSSTMRNVPDVAFNADPNTGYAIYEAGGWGVWGGTSCAAPIWAAYMALVNQQRESNGLGVMGFPNPALYAVGKSSNYDANFHDITSGTNSHYPAVSGYDNATGWGSPIGQALFNNLTAGEASGC